MFIRIEGCDVRMFSVKKFTGELSSSCPVDNSVAKTPFCHRENKIWFFCFKIFVEIF